MEEAFCRATFPPPPPFRDEDAIPPPPPPPPVTVFVEIDGEPPTKDKDGRAVEPGTAEGEPCAEGSGPAREATRGIEGL